MGAPANSRKRGEEFLYSNHQISPNFQVSKKPRFSLENSNSVKSVSSFSSIASRLSLYPEAKPPLRREVHAPSRGFLRFGSSDRSLIQGRKVKADYFSEKERYENVMGNSFSWIYHDGKPSSSYSLRDDERNNQVIDLDDEPEKRKVPNDFEVEEVEAMEVDKEKMVEEKTALLSSSSVVTELNYGDVLRVEDTDKVLDFPSSSHEMVGASSIEAYRKLLEIVERRNSKLKEIDFEIAKHEGRKAFLHKLRSLRKPVKQTVEEVPQEPFIPLTDEEGSEVQYAFASNNRRKILVTHKNSNIDITGQIMQCLRPGAWLNDEVINVYLELLKERENREPQKFLKCHFFNTFFYKKLICDGSGYNYKAVRRWTSQRKLGYCLIDCDKIFVPIHKQIHWCLAVINKKDRKFQYLDSLRGMDTTVLTSLAKYFVEEVKDKSGKQIDISSWEHEFVDDLPEQENGYDCGMFMLKYIDFYSRGLGLCFGQKHMDYFRVRTAKEILRLRAD